MFFCSILNFTPKDSNTDTAVLVSPLIRRLFIWEEPSANAAKTRALIEWLFEGGTSMGMGDTGFDFLIFKIIFLKEL